MPRIINHYANSSFWDSYRGLPKEIQELADKNFKLLKKNPYHPSLHLKKVGNYWSVRIGKKHRALGIETENNVIWF